MNNRQLILLSTLFRSTSSINRLRLSKDKKEKGKIIGNLIGSGIIYLIILGYCIAQGIGCGIMGMADAIPVLTVTALTAASFLLTFIKTNGYLFAFKEYDMLMAMPFTQKNIVSAKFIYMYVNSMPLLQCISLALMISYGVFAHPVFYVYIIWIVLSFLIPLIPMTLASALGALAAGISTFFSHKKIIQTILIFIFVIFCFCLRFILEDMFKNDKVEETIVSLSTSFEQFISYYVPGRWFVNAVTKPGIGYALLFIAVSVAIYEVFFTIVSIKYRQINSKLKSNHAKKNFIMSSQKLRSATAAIAFKEFRTFLSSTNYLVNNGMGFVLVFLLGAASLFVDMNSIIAVVTNNSPLTKETLQPALPLIIFFFTGMTSTTSVSPSLEGKNYWIVQSLPITKMTLYKGKMLFNMMLALPFTVFGTICLSISFGASLTDFVLFLLTGTVLCLYNTTWGLVCGLRHIKLQWENDIEVVKQGASTAIYLLPNMFLTMILTVGAVAFGMFFNGRLVQPMLIMIYGLISLLCWMGIKKMAQK